MRKKSSQPEKPINSMTAFARVSKQGDFGSITWEIKSINHRFLDLDLKLPNFLSSLEGKVRSILRTHLKRGHVVCYLRYTSGAKAGFKIKLNKDFVTQYLAALKSANGMVGKNGLDKMETKIDLTKMLSYPHALEESETNLSLVNKAALTLLEKALTELIEARQREGAALRKVLETILSKIEREVAKVKKRQPNIVAIQKQKLSKKFKEANVNLDPSRLEQEMVIFAQRIDVVEELDRLEVHLQEYRRVLAEGGRVGKRLDFLGQELNREANTLASKSSDVTATHAAVEIKVLLEQIREQVQNLE